MMENLLDLDTARRRDGDAGVSNLLLDRFSVGESLSDDELAAVEHALANDPAAAAYLDEIQASVESFSADEIATARGLDAIKDEVATRAHATASPVAASPVAASPVAASPVAASPVRRLPRWVAPAAAALALAAAVLFVTQQSDTIVSGQPGERIKGGEVFEVIAKQSATGVVGAVLEGETLRPDDAVRFRISHQGTAYVGIVGVDSAEAISVYEPQAGALQRLQDSAGYVFDGSIVLDDTLGLERFVAVFCPDPLGSEALEAAARQALSEAGSPSSMGPLKLPCAQQVVTITKVAP